MPIQTKYILENNGQKYSGWNAIRTLQNVLHPQMLTIPFPNEWVEMKRSAKLRFLSQYLPPGWVLHIIKQPKNTRKNISEYNEILSKQIPVHKKVQIPEPNNPWEFR